MTFRGSKIILSAFPSPLCTPPFPWKATRNFSSSALYPHFTKENMSIQAHYSTWKIFLITTLPWSREMLMFPRHKSKDKPAARCHGDTATYWSLLETYNERGLFWKTFSSKLCDIRPVRQAFDGKLVLLETLFKFLPVNLLGSQHFPDCNRSTLYATGVPEGGQNWEPCSKPCPLPPCTQICCRKQGWVNCPSSALFQLHKAKHSHWK